MKTLKDFTGLYSLSKTLRFELKPIGKTKEHIYNSGLLKKDLHRADSYAKIKKIIDNYHKSFIEEALLNFKLKIEDEHKNDSLSEFFFYYHLSNNKELRSSSLKLIQSNLRKQIADRLCKDDRYKRIDKKELITKDLLEFVKNEEDRNLIKEFSDFTTYFTGFNQNRKNMYTDDEKSTAIAYRLINENLSKFIDNMDTFEKVTSTTIAEKYSEIYSNFKTILSIDSINEMFELSYFSIVLTQKQIDIYNSIIGGINTDDGKKIMGLNEYINLYNQKQKDNKMKVPKLKPLFKQILSDRNVKSWLPEEFKNDDEMLRNIGKCYHDLEEHVLNKESEDEHSLINLLQTIREYDLNKIYIRNDSQLTDISKKIFGNWNILQEAVKKDYENTNPQKTKESVEHYEERKNKYFHSFDSFSIGYLNSCMELLGKISDIKVEDYFIGLGTVNVGDEKKENIFSRIFTSYANVERLLSSPYPQDKNLAQEKNEVVKIKALLDYIKELQWFIKPLLGKGDEADKDERFYGELSMMWNELSGIETLYNKVRNRMTRKPYSTEKIKLNFDNSILMNGWDLNKERDNTSVILRKDSLYYLGIMNKKFNRIFDTDNIDNTGECFEKMEYKFFKDLTTMVPKCTTQLNEIKKHFKECSEDYILMNDKFLKPITISKEIYDLNNVLYNGKKRFQIEYLRKTNDEKGYRKAVQLWIHFCLSFLNSYKSTAIYDISGFKEDDYKQIDTFYSEINKRLYRITFRNVSKSYIDKLVEQDKLYLFQIYNKDFSPYSKGVPNMHTLYWKMLFDEKNLQNVVYKLNGQSEVFFRKSSIKYEKPTHPAHIPIANKNANNKKDKSNFGYDLIKDRRYTIDKFEFHVPITINFKSNGPDNINSIINEYLKTSTKTHIIGIDRGERHLLYLSVIDMQGNIKEQYSLNQIINEYKGNTYSTNYHKLLDERECERDKERKSWQTIENIKELKEGYLSQVVHKIVQLIVKYNAIVVLEDLNKGFMRGRQKIEKQVYQKFERMLIDKLNYLVDKNESPFEPCGILNALQLTSKFDSFEGLGKQSGILFYIPAWNTSKMDPMTGFVNLFDTRYENSDKSKIFFSRFDNIQYNSDKNWFEFTFDYNNFTTKAEGTKTHWVICTKGDRIETFRNAEKNNQWDNKTINLTESFKTLFKMYNIDVNGNLKEKIISHNEKSFFECLFKLLKLTLQMRNSETGTDIDYLISPVAEENGDFFDSRVCNSSLPNNADANGAYNIARKGLWVLEQIKECDDLKRLKLAISNKDWLKFAQEKPYLTNSK
jgi:CRISPR-associated protein Cpf1